MDRIQYAREFAVKHHGDQRYDQYPYIYHIDKVAEMANGWGEYVLIVAYLHDVIEDTAVTYDMIRSEFDPLIAASVYLVTDEPGKNRKERKVKTNAKLAAADHAGTKIMGSAFAAYPIVANAALIVKAADRVANLSHSIRTKNLTAFDMYRSEHDEFRKAVYRPGLCDSLWFNYDNMIANGPVEMTVKPKRFSDDLDSDEQISAEEWIAATIFDSSGLDEENCTKMSKVIFSEMISRFRPDLINKE